jgi:hypothetical protein
MSVCPAAIVSFLLCDSHRSSFENDLTLVFQCVECAFQLLDDTWHTATLLLLRLRIRGRGRELDFYLLDVSRERLSLLLTRDRILDDRLDPSGDSVDVIARDVAPGLNVGRLQSSDCGHAMAIDRNQRRRCVRLSVQTESVRR